MKIFFGILCAGIFLHTSAASAAPSAEHPILGYWKFVLKSKACTEVYHFKADGTSSVTSGDEMAESNYTISEEPSASGYYKSVDTVSKSNGKSGCSGPATPVGDKATNYIRFHPSGNMMIMCQDESMNSCFGPLVRTKPGDI